MNKEGSDTEHTLVYSS